MKVNNQYYRSIFLDDDGKTVNIIDQTLLPHEFKCIKLTTVQDVITAIKDMKVRGAPLIGAVGAYGMALGLLEHSNDAELEKNFESISSVRPTAINLRWACDRIYNAVKSLPEQARASKAYEVANEICDEDAAINSSIGDFGLQIIEEIYNKKGKQTVNILTHCNAGWLAVVDWGTALAPIYKAHEKGIDVHVWVDETRPRNQGASLTAWELGSNGVKHTLVVDNAGGHLMQRGMVDVCFVGTDRTTKNGDMCNKIGTYLKALAAHANNVPFYVCLPSPTFDWTIEDAFKEIPIEIRDASEVSEIYGKDVSDGTMRKVRICPESTPSGKGNFGFDITPAAIITGLITERGICKANSTDIAAMFPDMINSK